jgi:hypothetical protein
VVRRFFSYFGIVALGLLLCIASVPAGRAADKPLTQDDLTLLLIGGASSQKVVDLVKQRGIAFQMNAELATEFRRDGADDSVIQALEGAAKGTAPSSAAAPASGSNQASTASGATGQTAAQQGTANGGGTAASGTPSASPAPFHPSLRGSGGAGSSSGSGAPVANGAPGSSSAQPSTATANNNPPPVIPESPGSAVRNSAAGVAPVMSVPPSQPEPVLAHHAAGESANGSSPSPAPVTTAAAPAANRAPVIDLSDPSADRVQQIIQAFAAKETLFKVARDNYTFHQINKVQELGPDNEVTGQFQQDWDILYDDNGQRIERVTYAPLDTLKKLILTEQDYDGFRQISPFVLTSDELPEYDIQYRGHIKVDQITAYVFSIRPKAIQKGKSYFQGMVWVDDRDLQIVKSEGKQVPEIKTKNNENLFPHFTTWREQIDGKFWFPTFTLADDSLYFSSGPVHIKEVIRYTDYKQFKTSVKTRVIGVVSNPNQQQQQNQKNPPKQ